METPAAISLPFSFNSNGSLTVSTDPKKIWQDRVTIAVMTYFGERVMRPNYGSGAKGAVFENADTAKSVINEAVSKAFSVWLSPLKLTNIKYRYENNQVDSFEVFYTYGGGGIAESVTINTAILSRAAEQVLAVR